QRLAGLEESRHLRRRIPGLAGDRQNAVDHGRAYDPVRHAAGEDAADDAAHGMAEQRKAFPAQRIRHLQHRRRLLPEAVAATRQTPRQPMAGPIQRHQMHVVELWPYAVEGGGIVPPAMQADDRKLPRLSPHLARDFDGGQAEAYFMTSHDVRSASVMSVANVRGAA